MAKILVVDDSELMRSLAKEYLDPMGHEVAVAETGGQALEAVGQFKPELVLMDVHLPDTTGFQVCQKLREEGQTFPILLMSASDAYSPWIHQLAQGFLFKPYTETILRSKVEALLGNGEGYGVPMPAHGTSWDSPVNLIHHLCSSIGSMSGLIDLFKAKKDDAAFFEKFIHLTEQSVESSMALIEEFAKLIQPIDLKKDAVRIDTWLNKAVLAHPVSQAPSVTLRWQIDSGSLAAVSADSERLTLAANAVLENAAEAMPDGGTLTLGAYGDVKKKWVYISFQDTGVGMEDYLMERACVPFFTMKKNKRGTGLSWAQKIVKAHGGELELSSTLHVGTCVLIRLPTAKK